MATPTDQRFSPTPGLVRVLLADGHALFRQAVIASLVDALDIVVVGEVPDAERDIDHIAALDPDVVLVDASGPQATAARTTALVKEHAPRCRVVVLGEEDPRILLDVVEAGASGYLTQDAALTDLIETARAVYRGETLIPQSLLGPLVSGLLERRRDEHKAFERLAKLTPREREVLELLATGANNQGIARVLSISPETARTHVQNLLTKLGVHSRLEAAAFIVQARPLVSAGVSR